MMNAEAKYISNEELTPFVNSNAEWSMAKEGLEKKKDWQ